MKVFMYESTIINLSEVKYIDVFLDNKIRASIRFHMKGENNEIVSLKDILSTKVPEILEECYKIMKED